MSASRANLGGWSRGHFLAVVTALIVIQTGLVLTFAERPHRAPPPPVTRTVFHHLGGDLDESVLSKSIFASDPTIFPSSSSHGFADQAWLRLAPVEYNKTTTDSEAPSFLEFTASRLSTGPLPPDSRGNRIPFDLPDELALPQETTLTYATTDASRAASFLRIDGLLSARRVDSAIPMRQWPSSAVLSNTVVSFGINHSGQVVSAGLWSGSGSSEADANAVATVNAMRFTPASGNPDELTWDRATFYWKSVTPPNTNAAPPLQFP
jgi:TonB family protein